MRIGIKPVALADQQDEDRKYSLEMALIQAGENDRCSGIPGNLPNEESADDGAVNGCCGKALRCAR
jgi:hypothetical protein